MILFCWVQRHSISCGTLDLSMLYKIVDRSLSSSSSNCRDSVSNFSLQYVSLLFALNRCFFCCFSCNTTSSFLMYLLLLRFSCRIFFKLCNFNKWLHSEQGNPCTENILHFKEKATVYLSCFCLDRSLKDHVITDGPKESCIESPSERDIPLQNEDF